MTGGVGNDLQPGHGVPAIGAGHYCGERLESLAAKRFAGGPVAQHHERLIAAVSRARDVAFDLKCGRGLRLRVKFAGHKRQREECSGQCALHFFRLDRFWLGSKSNSARAAVVVAQAS